MASAAMFNFAFEIQHAIDNAADDTGSTTCPESVNSGFSAQDTQRFGAIMENIMPDVLGDAKYAHKKDQVQELVADLILQFNYRVGQRAASVPVEAADMDDSEAGEGAFPDGF